MTGAPLSGGEDKMVRCQPTPQGLHISGQYGAFKLTIGEHDLSDIPVLTQGPIVENLTPGKQNPMRVAWVPFLFEGDIDDPEGILRVVHEGEANAVGLPEAETP